MTQKRIGAQSFLLDRRPVLAAYAAVGGKKEAEGPLAADFDVLSRDTGFGQPTWEQAETAIQLTALRTAEQKLGTDDGSLDLIFAGDLLDQCIASGFCQRETRIPFFGLYGACSTMAEGLALAGMAVDGGYADCVAAMASSHFAGAERQYRYPLCYGGQRTPTAQWTVTGAGCVIVQPDGHGPRLCSVTCGRVTDYGIRDANNMGAAMAPAAYDTMRAHWDDLGLTPSDYDLIVTGDLGDLGRRIVLDFFERDGVHPEGRYQDCGCMIYDAKRQDVHAGGSGAGCSAAVLCGHLLRKMAAGTLRRLLFCGTGALLSPLSVRQGQSIPAICHAVSIEAEGR